MIFGQISRSLLSVVKSLCSHGVLYIYIVFFNSFLRLQVISLGNLNRYNDGFPKLSQVIKTNSLSTFSNAFG